MVKFLGVLMEICVFVFNVIMGVNMVFCNIVWNKDGKDEILFFEIIYGGCVKMVDYVVEYNCGLVYS